MLKHLPNVIVVIGGLSDVGALVEALFSKRESVPPIIMLGHRLGL